MIYDIFIKTYSKDIQWLNYALKSIHKFVTGYSNIIVCIEEEDRHLLDHLTAEKIVTCKTHSDGYIYQQLVKLEAYKHSKADIITYWDSDVIALEPITPDDLMKDGKPIIYKTHYEKVGEAIMWKAYTEKALKQPVEYEFMRRFPLTYRRETLKSFALFMQLTHNKTVEDYILAQPYRQFSEFNVLGAYADKFEQDKYSFIDTETIGMPKNKVKQFWSWSGLTDDEKQEMEDILK